MPSMVMHPPGWEADKSPTMPRWETARVWTSCTRQPMNPTHPAPARAIKILRRILAFPSCDPDNVPPVFRDTGAVSVDHRLNCRGLQPSNVVPVMAFFYMGNPLGDRVIDFLQPLHPAGMFGPSCICSGDSYEFYVVAFLPLIFSGPKAKSVPFEQEDDAQFNHRQTHPE